jgi:hypothetical protein
MVSTWFLTATYFYSNYICPEKNHLYSIFWVIPRCLNFICRRFGTLCSISIGGVSRKNNRAEIVGVFIPVTVWFENSLSQSEGVVTSRGRGLSRETGCGGQRPQVEASGTYTCEGETALCRSEEGKL